MGCAQTKAGDPIEDVCCNDNNNSRAVQRAEDDLAIQPNVEQLLDAARLVEPRVTSLLESVLSAYKGELSGLEHKFKSRTSLVRKVHKRVDQLRIQALNERREDDTVDLLDVVWTSTDALRYTMILPTECYTAGVKAVLERFSEQGVRTVEEKNFWPGGDNYQGINDVFEVEAEGALRGTILFELQFHTPESFRSKMESHHFYETFRATADPEEKIRNWQALCKAAQEVPVPEGVLEIPYPRSNPNPGELQLYAELALRRALEAEGGVRAAVERLCAGAQHVDSSVMTTADLEEALDHLLGHDNNQPDAPEEMALQDAVQSVHEALCINVVMPEEGYVDSCREAARALCTEFKFLGQRNGWAAAASAGQVRVSINSREEPADPTGFRSMASRTWTNHTSYGLGWTLRLTAQAEDDGVAFTDDSRLPCQVTLHTLASFEVQEQLEQRWAEYRDARSKEDRAAHATAARKLRDTVPVPPGAQELRLGSAAMPFHL
mmetsp:Transcript_94851/g.268157  ORF Transcript_94851/g.268157 Transcript_94851/m.268157 type:complete len:493 (-) Transcript_94851:46-1524(-)